MHTGTSRSSTAASSAAAPRRRCRCPGPTAHAWVRPAAAMSSVAMTSGHRARTAVRGRPREAHHPAVASTAAPVGQHGRSRVGRRAGRDTRDALGVLVVGRAGHRPARRHVGLAEDERVRLRQLRAEPDVDQVHRAAAVRASTCTGLQRAEGDGRGGRDRGAVDGAGVGVHAAGRVHGQHRHPAAVRGVDQLGRGAGAAARGRRGRRRRPAPGPRVRPRRRRPVPAATLRPPARRSAASPSAWARCGSSSTAVTPTPRRRSSAPAHRASPPLSPAPTSSATRRPAAVGRASAARPRRARTRPGASAPPAGPAPAPPARRCVPARR